MSFQPTKPFSGIFPVGGGLGMAIIISGTLLYCQGGVGHGSNQAGAKVAAGTKEKNLQILAALLLHLK